MRAGSARHRLLADAETFEDVAEDVVGGAATGNFL
jgi:hypothetical protein